MGKVDKVEIDTARLQNVNKKELQTAFAAQDVSATNWVEDSSEPGLTACINSFREGKDTINMAITINDFSLKKSFNEKSYQKKVTDIQNSKFQNQVPGAEK